MTDADFLSITRNGRLCDDEGGLGEREFELVMREQVRPGLHAHRTWHAPRLRGCGCAAAARRGSEPLAPPHPIIRASRPGVPALA